MPAGTLALAGTEPTCTVVAQDVEFHCVLTHPPAPEVSDWKGTVEPTVDATKHVNGGCRSLTSDGLEWQCYIGEAAVDAADRRRGASSASTRRRPASAERRGCGRWPERPVPTAGRRQAAEPPPGWGPTATALESRRYRRTARADRCRIRANFATLRPQAGGRRANAGLASALARDDVEDVPVLPRADRGRVRRRRTPRRRSISNGASIALDLGARLDDDARCRAHSSLTPKSWPLKRPPGRERVDDPRPQRVERVRRARTAARSSR